MEGTRSESCEEEAFSIPDTLERIYLNDLLALKVKPGEFNNDTVIIFEKVKFVHISELFLSLNFNWVSSGLLPYLSTTGVLEELVLPNPILFRLEFINAVKEFLITINRPVKVTWIEEGHVNCDSKFNEENAQALKELFVAAREKAVTVSLMRMATYLKLITTPEYEKETAEMIQKLVEIDDGDFPMLKTLGSLMGKAENLERISIRDHESTPNGFDYGEVFPWLADWMPKKLQAIWISLPMCQESVASLKWPGSVVDVGLRVSVFEKRLGKILGNIDAQCPFLKNLDLCLENALDPNKAFSSLKPGDFKCLTNLQLKISAEAEFLLTDASLINLAHLPLVELILCFQSKGELTPGRTPSQSIPGSLITLKGITAISTMNSLLCFSVRIADGWAMRQKMETRFRKTLEELETKLAERKKNAPPGTVQTAGQFTLIALMASNMDTTWFFTMPLGMRRAANKQNQEQQKS